MALTLCVVPPNCRFSASNLPDSIAVQSVAVGPKRPILRRNRTSAFDAVDGSSTRHVSAMDVGAVKAPTIRRSDPCKRSRQSVSTLRSRFFRFTASTRRAMLWSAGSSIDATRSDSISSGGTIGRSLPCPCANRFGLASQNDTDVIAALSRQCCHAISIGAHRYSTQVSLSADDATHARVSAKLSLVWYGLSWNVQLRRNPNYVVA